VVEVHVGEKELNAPYAALDELEAKVPDAGAGVEHQGGLVIE
jgi:hypothetical protein